MTGKLSIVVSGPPAVGKTTLAKALASHFDVRYVSGGDVLKDMAADLGYDSKGDDWWDTDAGMSFLQHRESNHDFDRDLDRRLLEMFYQGGVVVTSYTLPWLATKTHGVKIWLDGSHTSSTMRMQNRDSVSTQDAYEITRKRYDRNRCLYKELYEFDFGVDMDVFDHIIRTDDLSAQQVTDAAIKSILDAGSTVAGTGKQQKRKG